MPQTGCYFMNADLNLQCYHCGEPCPDDSIQTGEHYFCCNGCLSVYAILHQHELDGYYCLNEMPGQPVREINSNKFTFLGDEKIVAKIIHFKNENQTRVRFYLPQIHCSSCLWLLENLHKVHEGILASQVNFNEKKVQISFDHHQISLKQVAELLASIGYEPLITLQDYEQQDESPRHHKQAIKLGIAGFCFANIMLISFPEYLGLSFTAQPSLSTFLRYVNLALSIPVFFYAAQEFFLNAWHSIRQRFLNIDAPIALAITITFGRSIYEIISNTGAGYLDSMSGIVFFMLIGRSLQFKTFTNLKFNRDFKSYFPISVTRIENGNDIVTQIQDIKEGDVLKLHHQEIIPIEGILSSKKANIDYSFVSGESECTILHAGEIAYAGGKIADQSIELIAIKPFSQNSFTALWNNEAFTRAEDKKPSFVDQISKYFSLVLFIIAGITFVYWKIVAPLHAWQALTAVLIVACPCTLLLASSYAYGFMIEWFAKEGMFVKNANAILKLQAVNHIVFDKTGTLSEINKQDIKAFIDEDNPHHLSTILSVLQHSSHPLSAIITQHYKSIQTTEVQHLKETPGEGIEAWLNDQHIKVGKPAFTGLEEIPDAKGSVVYFSIEGKVNGYFIVTHQLKPGVEQMIKALKGYKLSLLSGDNNASEGQMKQIFLKGSELMFQQSPQQKLDYIKGLQQQGETVLMIGDGINDAGALKQSDIGISVVDTHFSFSPASDAILNAKKTSSLTAFIQSAKAVKKLIIGTFIYSLLYNVIGISIAVSANLSPVIAAVLMPASSISVILITFIGTFYIHKKYLQSKP